VDEPTTRFSRRALLQASAAIPLGAVLVACGDDDPGTGAARRDTTERTTATLAPTPACADGDEPTVEQTEGPYFTPDSPERRSLLAPGVDGDRLVLAGSVLTTGCRPVRRALLDFWQADAAGEYDNEGFRLRGHQFTDARGRYRLETIVPGLYPGRTRHIHVKVQAAGEPVLTTQLYFPGVPGNDSDGIFDESLVIDRAGARGAFHFVLDV
jgi:protocatechuate 3,4-dioxygenase beta subunit